MKSPYIIIPRQHQVAPKKSIYSPHQITLKEITIHDSSNSPLLENLNVQPSKIHGLGLFAVKDFQRHQRIWYESLNNRHGTLEDDGPLRWTNHSDNPNALLILNQRETLEIGLVALTHIQKGREITYDYNVFGHQGYKAKCNCGNTNCKGYFILRTEWGEKIIN